MGGILGKPCRVRKQFTVTTEERWGNGEAPSKPLTRDEVIVIATQTQIDATADRIEHAYQLHRPDWSRRAVSRQVWSIAATTLIQSHELDPTIPIDPELFVAAQPQTPFSPNPWLEITGTQAARRYVTRVRTIVRTLRKELREEQRRAEHALRRGRDLASLLDSPTRTLSPLSGYILAQRSGQPAVAHRLLAEAAQQFASCPLYREACRQVHGTELDLTPVYLWAMEGPKLPRRPRPQQASLN